MLLQSYKYCGCGQNISLREMDIKLKRMKTIFTYHFLNGKNVKQIERQNLPGRGKSRGEDG